MTLHDLSEGPPLHRLTVAQYDQMSRQGILGPDDRVELLEGWLVSKVTKNPPHRIATHRVRAALERAVPGSGWYVDSQEPIVTSDSEPEPDVSLIRGRTEDYADSNPPASAVALVVEVADVTLRLDRSIKARIYARAGIPAYWILNLVEGCVEVHTNPDPSSGVFRDRIELRSGAISLSLGSDVAIDLTVSELLGS